MDQDDGMLTSDTLKLQGGATASPSIVDVLLQPPLHQNNYIEL